ncbi:GWxTD domain-containing protein [candidate division KSB1 bacterium]|nr:GWxTD domain-containing protein [candidate division KSB1 bacterium]NIR70607.1 GWxTD domain-containing protein [candidate division KSB1 bacterium]NIS24552.1 GWxTD domain-containing protein [candidate division KSB1 bacterium]NIT71470.1 GWxTD domain-containing protein [candidate division KSB1 bacterium]NIU25161.1 GWxTD domain-containing protein [candidate division KSB1 bacterium]
MKSILSIICFVLLLQSSVALPLSDDEERDKQLYFDAKKLCVERKWQKAQELFLQLVEEYPESGLRDDAQFWIGYCLEKREKSQLEAFHAYDKLIGDHPSSSWVDDAIVHQITIAEQLVRRGQKQYLEFLADKLESEDSAVRQHAALALGRLGDQRALPILNELENEPELGHLATDLIAQLTKTPEVSVGSSQKPHVEIERAANLEDSGDENRDKNADRDFLFWGTTKYEQYRSMLKKDEDWTKAELLEFGLWHIIPTEKFAEYNSLQGYDRKEWLRKFWKLQDPTPTTKLNEKYEEFKRRVMYARANFSELWDYKRSRFQKDQYLTDRWAHAPWDARGELYIKYGEPDFQTFAGLNQEDWNYYQMGVDFIVKRYVTNIYGNAIEPGPNSQFNYRDNKYYVDANFIYYPEFRVDIRNAYLDIGGKDKKSRANSQIVEFRYEIPATEFKIKKNADHYQISYLEKYVVFDEDMHEVTRGETTQNISDRSENALKNLGKIENSIRLNLKRGKYMVALRIEELENKRLGIFVENIHVD